MFVTGCHRSGTSLVAGVLSSLLEQHDGVEGSGARFEDLPPALDNPTGFFESQLLNQLNDEALQQIVCDWSHPPLLPIQPGEAHWQPFIQRWRPQLRRYALEKHWIDKDPRLCISLPLYQHLLLKRVPVLAVIRDPLEVAVSLHVRDGMNLNWALCLWFLYNHHLALALQPGDAVLSYASLLEPEGQLVAAETCSPWLFQHLDLHVESSNLRNLFAQHVDQGLQRSAAAHQDQALIQQMDPRLLEWGRSAYRQQEELVRSGNALRVAAFIEAFAPMPELWQRALASSADGLFWESSSRRVLWLELQNEKRRIDELNSQLDHRERRLRQCEASLEAVKNSWSWRVVGPFRRIIDQVKKYF